MCLKTTVPLRSKLCARNGEKDFGKTYLENEVGRKTNFEVRHGEDTFIL